MRSSVSLLWVCATALSFLAVSTTAAAVAATADVHTEKVRQCLENSVQDSRKRRTREKSIFIDYGLAGIEAIQGFGPLVSRQSLSLVQCVQQEAPELVQSIPADVDPHSSTKTAHFGGYNVTYLTGILSSLLPDVSAMVTDTLTRALQRSEWGETRTKFGLRSVYHLSATRSGLDEHKQSVRDLNAQMRPPTDAFVIIPLAVTARRKSELQERLDAAQLRLRRSLSDRKGTAYTVVVQLTDRSEAAGGAIVVHSQPLLKYRDNPLDSTKSHSFEDDYYDDEEEEQAVIGEGNKDSRRLSQLQANQELKTHVDEFILDRYSLFVVNGKYSHGFEPTLHGSKQLLVFEYWPYADVTVSGAQTASLEEGKRLGLLA